MKVAVVGANGSIGRVFLQHTLRRDDVTSVVAVTRKPDPSITSADTRVHNAIIPDFGALDTIADTTWSAIEDVDTLIWAIGTYDVNRAVNYEYPLAFLETLTRRRITMYRRGRNLEKLRFILLGGAFTQTDQSHRLYFLPEQRRTKGLLQSETLAFAARHSDYIVAHVVRPAGILIGWNAIITGMVQCVFGTSLAVRDEELGSFVASLAVTGLEHNIVENREIVEAGRSILQDAWI